MFRLITVLTMLAMLAPVNAVPQSRDQDSRTPLSQDSDMVTRLAYHNTYWTEEKDSLRQACFALYRDGHYKLLRIKQNGGRESLQGDLDQNGIVGIANMLKNLSFGRSIGGAILRDSEFFMADIANHGKIVRHAWLDPDGRNPLPDSAVKIVNWLQSFQPQDASPVALRELSDVCPAARAEPLPRRPN